MKTILTQSRIRKCIRYCLLICLVQVFMMCGGLLSVQAADYSGIRIDNSKSCTLTIKFLDGNSEQTTSRKPIDGAEFSLYLVQDLTSSGTYESTSDYSSANVKPYNQLKTAAEITRAASRFAEVAKDKSPAYTAQTTDSNGITEFSGIDSDHFGLYLVVETGKSGTAENYTTCAPFLVMVPYYDSENLGWEYDVLAEPKPVKPSNPNNGNPNDGLWPNPDSDSSSGSTTSSSTPSSGSRGSNGVTRSSFVQNIRTGDVTRIGLWLALMAAALVAVNLLISKREKKRKSESAD